MIERLKSFPEHSEIGYEHRSHPDHLAISLAIQAFGRDALAEDVPGLLQAYIDDPRQFRGPREPRIGMPACRSESALNPPSGFEGEVAAVGALKVAGRRYDAEELAARGAALAKLLPTLGERLIVHAGASLGPLLDHVVLAACLRRSAALALEPDADAFESSVLWTRPHVVIATPEEIAHFKSTFAKKKRRSSRLIRLIGATAERLEAVDV